jgi:predicted GH43/DUF377 family glycosyl hydrolase
MWYMGCRSFTGDASSSDVSYGYASSPDGINWTKHDQNPIMKPDNNSWDKLITNPNVLYLDGYYHMLYHGMQPSRIGYATSIDGIHWTKYNNNPIFKGESGKWDLHINYANFLYDSIVDSFKMWYTGISVYPSLLFQIGYATAPNDVIWNHLDDHTISQSINYELFQNYPNPFNPSTTIKFALPQNEEVKIAVFNAIGQNVKILLDRRMSIGFHEVVFNAQDLPSGIYTYKITAGLYHAVKKMLYLK